MDDRTPPAPDQASTHPVVTPPSSSRGAAEVAGLFAVLEATVLAATCVDPQPNPPPMTR
jgi:hypothetical protein